MAYQEGIDAYYNGYSSIENPYEYDTDEYVSWEAGWLEAYIYESE